MCNTDSGVCTPYRLVEHGTQHYTIGSVLSTSVSTHRVIWTPHVGLFVLTSGPVEALAENIPF